MTPVTRTLLFLCAAMTLCTNAICQPKSAGVSFCYSGTGVTYEYFTSPDTFVQLQLRSDSAEAFGRADDEPCFATSATWNIICGELTSRNGNKVRLLAGPGLTAGITDDYMSGRGPFAGLAGRFGGECAFDRGITLSVTVTPMLGVHLSRVDDYISMRMFRKGIIYAIMPEIGIKYTLGK